MILKKFKVQAGEMTQQLRVLAAPPEYLGSIPHTHMAVHSYLYLQFQGIWYPYTDIPAVKTAMHVKYFFLIKALSTSLKLEFNSQNLQKSEELTPQR